MPNVKVQHVSNDVKSIIEDVINDRYDKRLYEKLNTTEKRLMKRVVQVFNLDIDLNSKEDEDYQQNFEILLGEMNAGNNSPAIKTKLKQYVADSLESGFIPRRECFKILFELANS